MEGRLDALEKSVPAVNKEVSIVSYKLGAQDALLAEVRDEQRRIDLLLQDHMLKEAADRVKMFASSVSAVFIGIATLGTLVFVVIDKLMK